jgi:hypothetical protein
MHRRFNMSGKGMFLKSHMRGLRVIPLAVVLVAASAGFAAVHASAKTTSNNVIYNSTISPLPGNQPSVGVESSFFNEFGNQVSLAGTSLVLGKVTVTMSSWACQFGHWTNNTCLTTTKGAAFSEPITFNIYNANAPGSTLPGSLITTVTQTFSIPYRPSDNITKCPSGGTWYDTSSKTCFHGLATNITFDFTSKNVTLPSSIVYGIAYNTTDSGYVPIGTTSCNTSSGGCGYDSLNIALSTDPTNVTVGFDPNPGTVFQYNRYPAGYCDGGTAGTGVFRLDSPGNGCWSFGAQGTLPASVPAVQFRHQ